MFTLGERRKGGENGIGRKGERKGEKTVLRRSLFT
jgi:hypothetical protein